MSDAKKLLETLAEKVANLQKSVEATKAAGNDPAKSEALEKQLKDLVAAQVETQRKTILAEVRKGKYSGRDSDDKAPTHEVIVSKSDDKKVLAFQRWNDDVYMISKILGVHPHSLKIWQKYAQSHSELKKAMDSATAAEGLEWIPTNFSAELIDRVRLATKVAALFPQITMPSDPYKMPVVKSDATAYLVSENTADDPASKSFSPSTPQSRQVTLDAVKLGSRVQFSKELEEDSIIPIADFVKNQIALAIAYGLEDALLNGDTTSPHMDSDVTASNDARKAWKGLRKLAQSSLDTDVSTSFALSHLRTMRGKMGKFGADPSKLAYIVSAKGLMKLLGLNQVETLEKYGPNATVLQGELGKIDGIPIIVSEKMRDDLNTAGVNDATTNAKGLILLAYVSAFVLGEKRKVTLRAFEDVQNDQTALVGSWRGDFKSLHDETVNPVVVRGVNFVV